MLNTADHEKKSKLKLCRNTESKYNKKDFENKVFFVMIAVYFIKLALFIYARKNGTHSYYFQARRY